MILHILQWWEFSVICAKSCVWVVKRVRLGGCDMEAFESRNHLQSAMQRVLDDNGELGRKLQMLEEDFDPNDILTCGSNLGAAGSQERAVDGDPSIVKSQRPRSSKHSIQHSLEPSSAPHTVSPCENIRDAVGEVSGTNMTSSLPAHPHDHTPGPSSRDSALRTSPSCPRDRNAAENPQPGALAMTITRLLGQGRRWPRLRRESTPPASSTVRSGRRVRRWQRQELDLDRGYLSQKMRPLGIYLSWGTLDRNHKST